MKISTGENVLAITSLAIPVISIIVIVLTNEVALTINISSLPYEGKTFLIAMGKITFLNNAISSYLVKINNRDLAEGQSREIFTLVSVINYINLIKNGINLRFSGLLENKEKNIHELSDQAKDELVKYHKKMLKQIRRLARFFEKYDRVKIEKIITKGKKYKALEEKYRIENIKRKGDVSDNPVDNNQFYSDLMDMLKEISIFIELIASSLLDLESIEENSSR